ncbi:unnamed protein product, partial [Ectocarpus sp. 8 AP-2014]
KIDINLCLYRLPDPEESGDNDPGICRAKRTRHKFNLRAPKQRIRRAAPHHGPYLVPVGCYQGGAASILRQWRWQPATAINRPEAPKAINTPFHRSGQTLAVQFHAESYSFEKKS